MAKLYVLMGKSASGKDTVYHRLLADGALNLKPVVLYTTRPRREGEEDGRDYYFVDAGFPRRNLPHLQDICGTFPHISAAPEHAPCKVHATGAGHPPRMGGITISWTR